MIVRVVIRKAPPRKPKPTIPFALTVEAWQSAQARIHAAKEAGVYPLTGVRVHG